MTKIVRRKLGRAIIELENLAPLIVNDRDLRQEVQGASDRLSKLFVFREKARLLGESQ